MHDLCKHMQIISRGKFRGVFHDYGGTFRGRLRAELTVNSVCKCLIRSHAARTETKPLHTLSKQKGVFLLVVLMFLKMRGLKKTEVSEQCCRQSGDSAEGTCLCLQAALYTSKL